MSNLKNSLFTNNTMDNTCKYCSMVYGLCEQCMTYNSDDSFVFDEEEEDFADDFEIDEYRFTRRVNWYDGQQNVYYKDDGIDKETKTDEQDYFFHMIEEQNTLFINEFKHNEDDDTDDTHCLLQVKRTKRANRFTRGHKNIKMKKGKIFW